MRKMWFMIQVAQRLEGARAQAAAPAHAKPGQEPPGDALGIARPHPSPMAPPRMVPTTVPIIITHRYKVRPHAYVGSRGFPAGRVSGATRRPAQLSGRCVPTPNARSCCYRDAGAERRLPGSGRSARESNGSLRPRAARAFPGIVRKHAHAETVPPRDAAPLHRTGDTASGMRSQRGRPARSQER